MLNKIRYISVAVIFFALYVDILLCQVGSVGNQFFTSYHDDIPVSLPLFSNMNINEENSQVQKVIVVLHGANRNAVDYFNSINNIASSLSIQNETLIIAPQFLLLEDIESWDLGSTIPYWQSLTGWTIGNQSISVTQHPRDFQLSSYSIMDSLLSHLYSAFVNVSDVIFIGNSAGAQFINRYAGGSPLAHNEKIKFIISGPSSFLYFDENRYQDPNSWAVPSSCNNYNEYKYGLEDLNNYMSVAGVDSIVSRYQDRQITYLVGALDNGGTTDCQSMAQGQNRLDRTLNYYNYLRYFFGQEIVEKQKIIIIPNEDHYHNDIFSSPCGQKAIFGSGNCQQIDDLTAPSAIFSSNTTFGDYPLVVNFMNNSAQGTHDIRHSIWQLENESIYTNGDLEYTFNSPGEYDVSLIVIDKIGQRDTAMVEAFVKIDTLFGDVNLDAQISPTDVDGILQYSVGDMEFDSLQIASGDIDNDGTLSPFDGSLIMQYLEDFVSEFPVNDLQEYAAYGGLKQLDLSGPPGEIIQIPILLENGENIFSFRATINYDPEVLGSATVYTGSITELGFKIETRIEQGGKILIAGSGAVSASDEIDIANFYFIPSEFPSEESILYCDDLYLNNIKVDESFDIKLSQTLSTVSFFTPSSFSLGDNFPNPFNASTKIIFNLEKDVELVLQINNMKGQLIKSLVSGFYKRGSHSIDWTGKDNDGNNVVSGVYVYKILVKNESITKKMLFLK